MVLEGFVYHLMCIFMLFVSQLAAFCIAFSTKTTCI